MTAPDRLRALVAEWDELRADLTAHADLLEAAALPAALVVRGRVRMLDDCVRDLRAVVDLMEATMTTPDEPSRPVESGRDAAPTSPAIRWSGWTLAWTAWIAFFLVVEAAALFRKAPGDTFSEHWWSLFRVRARVPVPVRVALLAVQVGFGIWLVGHLAFGWWTL